MEVSSEVGLDGVWKIEDESPLLKVLDLSGEVPLDLRKLSAKDDDDFVVEELCSFILRWKYC